MYCYIKTKHGFLIGGNKNRKKLNMLDYFYIFKTSAKKKINASEMEGNNLDFLLPKGTDRCFALIPLSHTKLTFTKFDSAAISD